MVFFMCRLTNNYLYATIAYVLSLKTVDMNQNKVQLEIAKIFSAITGLKTEEINPELSLKTVNLNLRQQADLLIGLEDKFQVPISFRKISEVETVENLLQYVSDLVNNN